MKSLTKSRNTETTFSAFMKTVCLVLFIIVLICFMAMCSGIVSVAMTGCASESAAQREQRHILKEMKEFAEHDEKERPIVKYY